jgi:hypothetical protein
LHFAPAGQAAFKLVTLEGSTHRHNSGSFYRGPDDPHLHISASLTARTDAISRQEIDLDSLHIATGHVSLADVVQMLITEFSIAPQQHDWNETLLRTRLELAESVPPD